MVKKQNGLFLTVFVLVFIILFIAIGLNYQYVKTVVVSNIAVYGLVGVMLFSFLADVLEQPVGPEVPASAAVALGLNPYLVFGYSVVGSFIGSVCSFFIGRYWLAGKVRYTCSTKKGYRKYCNLFDRYGRASIAIASISPVPYVFFCWLVGAFHMRLRDFIAFGLLPRALRIGFFIFLFNSLF